MNYYYAAAGAYLVYVVTAFGTAKLLDLTGSNFYIFFGLLTVLGLFACGAFIWFKEKYKNRASAGGEAPAAASPGGGGDEVEVLIREAETRLSASKLAQGANIGNLPLLFIIGENGAAKTTSIVRSGIEPELLAGQVFQESNVAPTRSANIWFARSMIFAEAGARMMSDSNAWIQMVKRLKPGNLKSVVGGSTQAPRGVLLCFDSEIFTRPNVTDQLTAMSRNLQTRLGEISQTLGISLPVYVLFTRADRLPFFAEYMRTLSNEEAQQVLGVTLPIRAKNSTGVYAEEETQRINWAFGGIFHSLCDKRNEFLARENDPDKLPGAYEFPREFRKIRGPLVQFLVDVCRPSQLRASPFLRGFYFSGVRPIVVNDDMVQQPVRQAAPASFTPGGSATGIFHVPQAAPFATAPQQPQFTGTKKVPQWMFLPHLFHYIILKDSAAMGASVSSVKTSKTQRILLGMGALVCLFLTVGFTISYFKNRSLENTALEAAQQLAQSPSPGAGLPSKEDLTRLETLRTTLETINEHRANGIPFMLRWFLYSGEDLYPHVRQAYYNNFGKLLFWQTQKGWQANLEKLPGVPGPTDPYRPVYDTLKAYLITTTNNDKSTREFLSPFLFKSWSAGKEVESLRDLANRQFDFYSDDLRKGNPYPLPSTNFAVTQGRVYLWGFGGAKRVYQEMINEASARFKPVSFPKTFPDATSVVTDNYEVSGAFTKDGYAFVQNAIRSADKYSRADWVLAQCPADKVNCSAIALPTATLQQQLQDDYTADFIAQWRTYLRTGRVLPYASLEDAADKLDKQRSNRPPLMQLLWLAGQNTAVDSPRIKLAFDSVQQVTPASLGNSYAGDANRPYLGAIGDLQVSIADVVKLPPPPDAAVVQATRSKAGVAINTVKQIAGRFAPDSEAKMDLVVQRLLEAPITLADGLFGKIDQEKKAAQGKGLCDAFRVVAAKFPFNSKAQAEVTLAELASLYKPGEGALWQFYEANLKTVLPKPSYNENVASGMALNPRFVSFFRSAAAFSEAIYRDGPDPKIPYRVTPLKSDNIEELAMTLDGQVFNAPAGGGAARLFTWLGSANHNAALSAKGVPPTTYQGLWAPFRLFSDAEKFDAAGSGYNMEWYLRLSFARNSGGANAARFNLDLGQIPIFFRGNFAGIQCVSQVAK